MAGGKQWKLGLVRLMLPKCLVLCEDKLCLASQNLSTLQACIKRQGKRLTGQFGAEGKVQREKNQMVMLNHDDSDEAQTPATAAARTIYCNGAHRDDANRFVMQKKGEDLSVCRLRTPRAVHS